MGEEEEGDYDSLSTGFEPDPRIQVERPTEMNQQNESDQNERLAIHDEAYNDDEESNLIQIQTNNYNPDGTNDLFTVFLIVNAALGAGLLNFPKAFDESGGILCAVLVQLFLIVFIVIALNILAYAADKSASGGLSATLQDVIGQTNGRVAKILVSFAVVVYCFGTTVTFLIMIGDQYDRIFLSLVGEDFDKHFYMNRDFTMFVTGTFVILPLCFSKRIDFLRIPSLFGVVAIVYLVGLIIYEYYYGNFIHGPIKYGPDNWTDVFLVVPDICFGYQCHVSIVPIYSCMKHRNLKSFFTASSCAIGVCAFAYTGAAAFGYLTFGSNVNNDILLSYDATRPEVIIGILAMALKTITTYPILLFCGREAFTCAFTDIKLLCRRRSTPTSPLDELVAERTPNDPEQLEEHHELDTNVKQRCVVVLFWYALSLLCAILVPNIGTAISFLGCLAAVFIFTIPGLILMALILRSDSSLVRTDMALLILSGVFNVIGAFIFGVVLTQDVQRIVYS